MHDHAVRGAGRLCHLARSVNRVTPRSVVVGYPLLGKASFSEQIFMPSLSGFFSVSPIFCSFCFILPSFSFPSWAHFPVLRGSRLLTRSVALQLARCAIRELSRGRTYRRWLACEKSTAIVGNNSRLLAVHYNVDELLAISKLTCKHSRSRPVLSLYVEQRCTSTLHSHAD